MRHQANLDILRSFAVGAVLLSHILGALHEYGSFHNTAIRNLFFEVGHAGVIVFFVHTSLVLMYSLERLHHSFKRVALRFYVRRFFRIYPLAIFVIVMAVVLKLPASPAAKPEAFPARVIVANLLLVQNLVAKQEVQEPLWSLPYEVQMYVVLPFLFLVAVRKNALLYLSGLTFLFCLLGVALSVKTGHLNMAAYVPCFLSGVLCYALRKRISPKISSQLWAPFIMLLLLGYCFANRQQSASFWSGWVLSGILGLSINMFHDSTAKPVNFVFNKIALYSYGIYLLNEPVLYLIFVILGLRGMILEILLFLGLTLAASMLAFHLIESPFIELGRRLSSPGLPRTRPELSSEAPAP